MITRSPGTAVYGYIVGGGYDGATKELDDIVAKEAELLGKTFNRDITIRFNSNRLSGGAWLVNSLEGFAGNCQVGFNAGLRPVRPPDMDQDEYFKKWDTLPKTLYIDTYVAKSALKDKSLCNGGTDNDPRCYIEHATVEDGIKWLIDNIDRDSILS